MTVGNKLFFWHTLKIFEFILISHGAICKSDKPHGLILHWTKISYKPVCRKFSTTHI
jgi:hypothetical protein